MTILCIAEIRTSFSDSLEASVIDFLYQRYNYTYVHLSLLLCPAMPFYDYARQYVSVCPAIFYGVYCYMKLQGCIRLVNVTMIYYTMDYLTLLTGAYI